MRDDGRLARRLSRARRNRTWWRDALYHFQREKEVPQLYEPQLRDESDRVLPCWKFRSVPGTYWDYGIEYPDDEWSRPPKCEWCPTCHKRERVAVIWKKWRHRAASRLAAITRMTRTRRPSQPPCEAVA